MWNVFIFYCSHAAFHRTHSPAHPASVFFFSPLHVLSFFLSNLDCCRLNEVIHTQINPASWLIFYRFVLLFCWCDPDATLTSSSYTKIRINHRLCAVTYQINVTFYRLQQKVAAKHHDADTRARSHTHSHAHIQTLTQRSLRVQTKIKKKHLKILPSDSSLQNSWELSVPWPGHRANTTYCAIHEKNMICVPFLVRFSWIGEF